MTIPAPTWNPSAYQYHTLEGGGHWSASMLKRFRHSPQEAFIRYVSRIGESLREERQEALVIGSAVNSLLLDPAGGALHVVQGVSSTRAGAFRVAVETWGRERLVLTAREHDVALACAGVILDPQTEAARTARALLTEGTGYNEWAHRWDDPATGVPLKTMIDRLTTVWGVPAVIELKSARDVRPRQFLRQIESLEYDAQAAHNIRGVQAALADAGAESDEVRFFFVAVKNSWPHEVAVYEAGPGLLAYGESITLETLGSLREALESQEQQAWRADFETLPGGEIPILETRRRFAAAATVTEENEP